MPKITWKRAGRGRQVSTDGMWAVEVDGFERISQARRDGAGVDAGITGREWCAIRFRDGDAATNPGGGENMDWFDTMRDAKAFVERQA